MASAVSIGCSWCVDFGYWETTNRGIDPVKMRDVPRWRDSDVYTDLERQVMAYAEAVTATPPAVTDEMVAELRRELDDAALVELTMMVAVENVRSRFNSSLGLTSQGFKDRCEIPASHVVTTDLAAFDQHRRLLFTRGLPDARQRRRRRGRRAGHLAALVGRRPRRGRRPARLPGPDHHPARARPDGLGPRAAGELRRAVAARAAADRGRPGRLGPAGARARGRRRARRAGVPGAAGGARDAVPGRAGGLRAPRGLRDVGRGGRRGARPLRGRRPADGAPRAGSTCRPGSRGSTPTGRRSGR